LESGFYEENVQALVADVNVGVIDDGRIGLSPEGGSLNYVQKPTIERIAGATPRVTKEECIICLNDTL